MPILNKTFEAHDTIPAGVIISMDPPAGTPLTPSDIQNVVVSLGDVETAVPDIVGMGIVAARAAIFAAGLIEGTITYDIDVPNLYIITAQSPAAFTEADPGDPVNHTVGVLGEVAGVGEGSSRGRGRRH